MVKETKYIKHFNLSRKYNFNAILLLLVGKPVFVLVIPSTQSKLLKCVHELICSIIINTHDTHVKHLV